MRFEKLVQSMKSRFCVKVAPGIPPEQLVFDRILVFGSGSC